MHWEEILTRFKIKSSEKARPARDFDGVKHLRTKSCKILHNRRVPRFYAQAHYGKDRIPKMSRFLPGRTAERRTVPPIKNEQPPQENRAGNSACPVSVLHAERTNNWVVRRVRTTNLASLPRPGRIGPPPAISTQQRCDVQPCADFWFISSLRRSNNQIVLESNPCSLVQSSSQLSEPSTGSPISRFRERNLPLTKSPADAAKRPHTSICANSVIR